MIDSQDKTKETPNNMGLTSLYSGIIQNMSIIHSADNAIESKTTAILAGNLVVITLIFNNSEAVISWQFLTIVGLLTLLASIIISLILLWSRSYGGIVVDINDNQDYLDMDDKKLILHLISDAQNSSFESNKILSRKANLYRWAVILFAIGSAISMLSFHVKFIII
jgi:hypothetical protein